MFDQDESADENFVDKKVSCIRSTTNKDEKTIKKS
jgi:hypothetical protein